MSADKANRVRIAVVDDDASTLAELSKVLRANGFEPVSLSAPPAPLDAELGGLAAVVMSVRSEPMRIAVAKLNNGAPHLPIVAIVPKEGSAVMRAGAYDWVTWPKDDGRLVASVRRAVERHDLAHRLGAASRELREARAELASRVEQNGVPVLSLRELEQRAIACALKETRGSITKAAKLLGIGRATLYRRLAEEGRIEAAVRSA